MSARKNMKLHERLNSVKDEESLMVFVEALVNDLDDEIEKKNKTQLTLWSRSQWLGEFKFE